MSQYVTLAEQAFDNWNGVPHRVVRWTLADAFEATVSFLISRNGQVDLMPGLRQAFRAMTEQEWQALYRDYGHHGATLRKVQFKVKADA